MEKITIKQFKSFREYHKKLYDDFVTFKDYDSLEEYVMLIDFIELFRKLLRKPEQVYHVETYILEMKRHAYTFNELCDQYGYDDDYKIIIDYTDIVLSL